MLLVLGSALTVLHLVLIVGVRLTIDCVTFITCCWCWIQHRLCNMQYLLLVFGSASTVLHVLLVAGVKISIACVYIVFVAGVRISIACVTCSICCWRTDQY